jgi:putative restriction endonuclease
MPSLDDTLRALKRDRANDWDSRTLGGAPHKPLVLLALCDLAESGRLVEPLAPFDGPAMEALASSFQSYWREVFPDSSGALHLPLWHLRSDGLFDPVPRDGGLGSSTAPRSMSALRERFAGARLHPELFARLLEPAGREALRALLLGACFDPPTRAALIRRIDWNRQAEAYARRLLHPRSSEADRVSDRIEQLGLRADLESLALPAAEPVRTQGFRIAVVTAYEHRCAACGLRLQTPDGLTAVQAAHIKPWSLFHDDRVANGLALCPTCHWSFDQFLWTTRPARRITPTRALRWHQNLPGPIEQLDGRDLFTPAEPDHHPSPECLGWHREQARIA